ncbi:MAG: hypothetical protein WDO24_27095 [Pseudomonadota bacterium]
MDTKIGPKTRIEVVTDGVFVRMLQQDPALSGIGLVGFDEIHERSLDSDLNLALCLEVQGALRRDLRFAGDCRRRSTAPRWRGCSATRRC